MSEQETKPAERTLSELQNQYTGLCNKAGHLQYQIYTFKKDLDLVNSTLRDLNFEAAALQAKEAQNKTETPVEAKEEVQPNA